MGYNLSTNNDMFEPNLWILCTFQNRGYFPILKGQKINFRHNFRPITSWILKLVPMTNINQQRNRARLKIFTRCVIGTGVDVVDLQAIDVLVSIIRDNLVGPTRGFTKRTLKPH